MNTKSDSIFDASVVIPVFNSENSIADCLDSLSLQNIDNKKFEVICVDDGSNDSTKEILNSYKKLKNLKIITQKNSGPGIARNVGAAVAESAIIIFTDSDCILDRSWIKEMIKPFKKNILIVGVQGCYKTNQKKLICLFEQFEIERSYKRMFSYNSIDSIGTYSAAYRKDIFFQYGGFSRKFKHPSGEDFELSYKIHESGHKLVINEKAVCYHKHPDTFFQYFKTKFIRGYWRVFLHQKFKKKIIHDTYSYGLIKIAFLLVLIIWLSLIFSFYDIKYIYISFSCLFLFIVLLLPFFFSALTQNILVALSSPLIIFFRATFFIAGFATGLIIHFFNRIKNYI